MQRTDERLCQRRRRRQQQSSLFKFQSSFLPLFLPYRPTDRPIAASFLSLHFRLYGLCVKHTARDREIRAAAAGRPAGITPVLIFRPPRFPEKHQREKPQTHNNTTIAAATRIALSLRRYNMQLACRGSILLLPPRRAAPRRPSSLD